MRPFALASLLLSLVACSGGSGSAPNRRPDAMESDLTSPAAFGTPPDGATPVRLDVLVANSVGRPLRGMTVELRATGRGTSFVQPADTDANGEASGMLTSTVPQTLTVRAFADPGPDEVLIGELQIDFVEVLPNSYFVRAGGSDANAGDSPLRAWRTLAHAIGQVGAGDTLYVGAGTYEAITVSTVASASQPLVLRGDRAGVFTGDAGDVLIDAGGGRFGVELAGAAHVTVRGFSITGAAPGAVSGGGIWLHAGDNQVCTIRDVRLYENERGLHVQTASDLAVEDCRVSMNFGDGVVLDTTARTTLFQNLIYANDGAGLALTGASTGLQVGLNTFYRNEGDQIDERVAGSAGLLIDNLICEGGGDALAFAAGTSLSATSNMAWANSGSNAGAMVADPRLVDPFGADGVLGGVGAEDDDFRLAAGSPAFDAGDPDARETFLPSLRSAATLTSRTDGLRDGEPTDGPEVNLGFHYPAMLDAFASRDEFGGRIGYVLPDQVTLRTIARDEAGSYGAPLRTQDTNSQAKWVLHRLAPQGVEELAAVQTDTGSSTQLYVRRWDGRLWSDDVAAPVPSAIQSSNTDERGFDLAYESLSGDALFVRSNDDANPLFRTLVDGVWSQDAPVFAPALGTGTVLWIELVPDPSSDRIALLAQDDQENLTAAVWDGDAWTVPMLLDTEARHTRTFQSFDAAWESQSGDLLVCWGFSQLSELIRFATLDAGSSTWQLDLFPSQEAIGAVVRMSADPTTDRIVCAFGEGLEDDDVAVSVWDGDAFVHTAEMTLFGVFEQHSIDVGWIGDTGVAFVVWRNQGQVGSFEYARFSTSWNIIGAFASAGVGQAIHTEVRRVPGTAAAELLVLDDAGSLFALRATWDGANVLWNVANGGQPIETGLDPALGTRAFSFDLR